MSWSDLIWVGLVAFGSSFLGAYFGTRAAKDDKGKHEHDLRR